MWRTEPQFPNSLSAQSKMTSTPNGLRKRPKNIVRFVGRSFDRSAITRSSINRTSCPTASRQLLSRNRGNLENPLSQLALLLQRDLTRRIRSLARGRRQPPTITMVTAAFIRDDRRNDRRNHDDNDGGGNPGDDEQESSIKEILRSIKNASITPAPAFPTTTSKGLTDLGKLTRIRSSAACMTYWIQRSRSSGYHRQFRHQYQAAEFHNNARIMAIDSRFLLKPKTPSASSNVTMDDSGAYECHHGGPSRHWHNGRASLGLPDVKRSPIMKFSWATEKFGFFQCGSNKDFLFRDLLVCSF